jgi:purine-cytosine permease-like protein
MSNAQIATLAVGLISISEGASLFWSVLAIVVGVLFFDVGTLYEGVAAKALDGADISFFIGLPVAGILYYLFSRSVDVAAETRVAEAEAADLETAARPDGQPT